MKSTGIVRKVDDLGRVVLPIELRRSLSIDERDPLEIHVEGDQIILRKHTATCVFCNSDVGISEFKGKTICAHCRNELQTTA